MERNMEDRPREDQAQSGSKLRPLLSKIFKDVRGKAECTQRILHLWREHVSPHMPVTRKGSPKATLEDAQEILDGLAQSVQNVSTQRYPRPDWRAIPQFTALWGEMWHCIKLIYSHLPNGTSSIDLFHSYIGIAMLSVMHADICKCFALTPGYVHLLTKVWIGELKYAPHLRNVGCSPSLTSLINLQRDDVVEEVIRACGGKHVDVVNACLDHMSKAINERESHENYVDAELKCFHALIRLPLGPFMPAIPIANNCVGVMLRMMKRALRASASDGIRKFSICSEAVLICLALGETEHVKWAMQGDILYIMLRAARFGSLLDKALEAFCIRLQKFAVYRSILSVASASLARSDVNTHEIGLAQGTAFFKAWKTMRQVLEERQKDLAMWSESQRQWSTSVCGNTYCRKAEIEIGHHLFRCSGCLLARFCSRACQKKAWARTSEASHRRICKFMQVYQSVNPSHVFSSPDLNFFGELVARTLLDKHRGRFTSNKSLDNPKLVTVDLTVSPIRVDVSPLPGHDSFRLLDYASFDQGSHTVLPPDELSREVFNGLTSGGENASMLSILVPRPGDQKHWLAALMDYWATPRGGVSGPTAGICWIFSA